MNILVIFIKFGTDTGAIRFLADYKGNSKNHLIGQYRLFSLNRILLISFLFSVFVVFHHIIGNPIEFPFEESILFYLVLAGFLLAHSQYRRGELLGVGRPIISELSESILKPVLLLGWALLIDLNSAYMESEDLIRVHIVVLVVTSMVSLLISSRIIHNYPKLLKKELSAVKQDWVVSTKGMATNVLIRQLIKSADILLCAALLDTTQVAFYVVATRLADLVVFALTSANLIFAPKISLLFSRGNKAELNTLLKEASQTAFVIGGLLFLLLVFAGQYLLSLYGTEYVEGYSALIILSVGQLINSYFGPSGYLASMTGNQDQLTKALLASGAIAIVSYIIFIPLLGIEGAALSSMLGTISWNILIYLKMSRLEGLRSKAF
ncbi:hypothetical protein A3766_12410 [Oleiphilus sp. HI0132]|uniref:lipopolysaccharide biosynthesis protein n=2 Tax=Oleiphilus sp. HI0132 TaxID=1822270 RepID=UPI0007C3D5E2|nr:polysaccharide biosynthesis C-terminal domain-containing protein [Oleiphilus sp. HI0132]KZZ77007.1 hypothetical protein A3766_12410 [Oleiphilus sp. HI0132]